jgi:deoxyribose-phosphate aldolase
MEQFIDHTNLNPTAREEDIKKLCEEAKKYSLKAVCVHPHWISLCKNELAGSKVKIATVVGFPLGQNTTEVKVYETKDALNLGADEIDMVINISKVKDGLFENVLHEISELKKTCGDKILKVIIETCYLTKEEKIKLCELCNQAKVDFIKTSTGFGTSGAQIEDIILFKKHLSPDVKIKASGGIREYETAKQYINLGVERIGTSSGVQIVTY